MIRTMSEDYYNKVEKGVLDQFDSDEYRQKFAGTEQGKGDKNHFFEVVKIVSELWRKNEKKEIPVALKIAALCHDLDRVYPNREVNTKNCSIEDYGSRKAIHSGNSALIFFEKNNEFPIRLLRDVSYLILRHEFGGDKDKEGVTFKKTDEFTQSYNLNIAADYLYYSDKLSFFYSAIYEYSKRSKERLKTKIEFSIKGLPKHILEIIKEIKFNNNLINECILEVLK